MRCIAAVLSVLLLTALAVAQVQVTLPLEGYWRPGRYMPVRVAGQGVTVEVGGDGVVPSRVALTGVEITIPLLMMSDARSITWSAGAGQSGVVDKPLRQLNHEQRLVGFTTIDLDLARKLFPGDSIIPIQLPQHNPLPGPAGAWDTFDAVVLDAALDSAKEAELRACGVMVVMRSAATATSPKNVGPRASAEDLAAFAPVQGWQAEVPAPRRRQIILTGIILALAILAVSLLRFRFNAIVIIGLFAATAIVLATSFGDRAGVLMRREVIETRHAQLVQVDEWFYMTSAVTAEGGMPWRGATRPFFESPEDRMAMKPVLLCTEDGSPLSWSFQMRAGQKVAFLSRSFQKDSRPDAKVEPADTPLELLAKRMYLRPGVSVVGQVQLGDADDRRRYDLRPVLILKSEQ